MTRKHSFISLLFACLGFFLISCQKQSDNSTADINGLKTSVLALQKTTDSLSKALAASNANISGLTLRIDSIKTQILVIQNQITFLTTQITVNNTNITVINNQLVVLNQQYLDLLKLLNEILSQLSVVPTTMQSGLVAYYPFTGNANDSSGNNNHGTTFGVSLTADRFGNTNSAVNLNSNNQYIRTNSAIQNVINTFSVSVWVNPKSIDLIKSEGITGLEGYGTQSIIHPTHGVTWGNASTNAGIGLNVGTNQIQVTEHTHLFIASPLVFDTIITGWHNITVVYNTHVPSLYLDGKLVHVGLATNIQNVRPSNGYCAFYSNSGFGTSFAPNGTTTGQFIGQFDDIRIYNRVLTQAEITYLAKH
jgi:hypothetical protein